jgi:hypothetical protein
MMHQRKRSAVIAGLLVLVLGITAATQAPVFKGGYFKATDNNTTIGLDFDSTGVINVSVDGQAFATSSWKSKADTLTFGPVSGGAEGTNCPGDGKYLWSIAENRITFTLVMDDCQFRSNGLINLVWMKG